MSDSSSSTSQNFENMDGIAQIDPDTDSQSFDQSGNQHLPDDELVKEGGLYGDEDSQTRSAALVNDEEEGEYYDEDMINLDNNDLNYEEEQAEYGSADSDSRLLHLPDENEEQIDREMTQVSDTEDDTEMPENGVNGNHENGAFVRGRGEELTLENIPADEISAGEEEDGHQNQAIETELGSEEGELLEDDEEEGMKGKAEELTEHNPVDDLDLEDGEIVDSSDDGIPEIKDGGLSPPSATKLSNNRQTSSQQCYISSGSSPYNSRTRYQPVEKERELCRFFLRGNCKNGELCRFKHTRDASSRVQSVSSSICSGKVPNYYNRAPIPPPVGPPISLLSTEFAPPPSLMVRPSAPVNAESAAWEQGLKKARELVRRQKGESIDEKESENSVNVDENQQQFESSGSPPLATISPDPYSPTVEPYDNNSLRSFTSSHSISTLNRRPIASRVVVEAVSVVTAPLKESSSRLASRVVRPVSTTKPRSIPSLIDEIFEHPITEPPPAPLEEPKTRREERGSRQTLSGTRYSDPWARHGKNNSIDKREDRRHMDRHRKRHHSTSSASPSENDEKRPHIHRQHSRHHRQKEGERQQSRRYSQQNDEFVDEGKVVAEKERGIKRRTSEEEQRESRKKIHQRTDDMDKDSKRAVKKRKTESEESSSLTFQHEKVWRQKNQAKKIRSNSMSSSSSSSSTESVNKSATLGALLVSPSKEGIKNKGPKTPPEEDRQSSRNSSNSSTSTWNRDKRHSGGASPPSMVHGRISKRKNSQIKRETQRNTQSVKSKVDKSGFFSKENDEDDAPAAYRIPRRVQGIESGRELNKNRRLSRSSSLSSSSSSSSATSSTNSAISSPSHQKAKIGKSVLKITNEQKVEENALVSKAIICSSTREPKTPPLDDERMDRISSGDEEQEPNEIIKIGMTPRKPVSEDFSPSNSPTETGNKFMNSFVKAENNGEQKDVHNKIANEGMGEQMNKKLDDGNKGGNTPKELEEANNRKPKSDVKNKELTQKRREELRRKLQSVEEAIARKKQQQTAQKDE